MSCLFNSLAALLGDRPDLLTSSSFAELRDIERPPTGASIRAAICALLDRRAIEVHSIPLDEWGAMEEGTTRDAYVRGMRDEGTWGGGVEIAAIASALRAQIVVRFGSIATVFGAEYAQDEDRAPMHLRYTGTHYMPLF
jgi:hypothetical protein